MRIDSILVYWKNELPGGVGLQLAFETETEGKALLIWIHTKLAHFDTLGPEKVNARIARLAAQGESLTRDEAHAIAAMVFWLEKRGHLKPDDTNGIALTAVDETGQIIHARGDVPSDADLRCYAETLPTAEIKVDFQGVVEGLDKYLRRAKA